MQGLFKPRQGQFDDDGGRVVGNALSPLEEGLGFRLRIQDSGTGFRVPDLSHTEDQNPLQNMLSRQTIELWQTRGGVRRVACDLPDSLEVT